MNKILSRTLTSAMLCLFTLSCTNNVSNGYNPVISQASVKNDVLAFKLVQGHEISPEILKLTLGQAQEMADKESKRRGIDLFKLPQKPIGLEIYSGNKNVGYILNFIGTSKNTEDLNVEVRAMYSEKSSVYSLNYSGPVTNTKAIKSENAEKPLKRPKNDKGVTFELIQGLPQEYIVNTFEEYLNGLNNNLKKFYRPKTIEIAADNVFIYAIHYNGQLKGFFFESHGNKVILGERKYADMQIGVMITTDNKVTGNYALVAFNPKTEVNGEPEYQLINSGEMNIIEIGEL